MTPQEIARRLAALERLTRPRDGRPDRAAALNAYLDDDRAALEALDPSPLRDYLLHCQEADDDDADAHRDEPLAPRGNVG